jgi:hypothetical protein
MTTISDEATARAEQGERAGAAQADDTTGHFYTMVLGVWAARQAAIAEARATADAMAEIINKHLK